MNFGQYLTQYSPLPSGTVAQHIMAIGAGQGLGTVFVSQFNVRLDQQELVVTRRAKRRVQAAPVEAAPRQVANAKDIAVLHRVPTLAVLADVPDELTVQQRTSRSVVLHKLDNRTITKGVL